MMYGNCTSKKELLQFIDQVSFAIDDLLLFLDTHPKEKRALEYYSELSARRNELLEKYAKFYGPLTAILSHGSGWNSRFHGNRKEGADKVCGIMKKDSSIL